MNQATTLTSQVITGILHHQHGICINEKELQKEKSNIKPMQSPQFRSPVLPHCEFQKNESIIWIINGERADLEKDKQIET